MMDSQENALLQQSTLDPAKKAYATKQEVLERVKELLIVQKFLTKRSLIC